MTERDPPPASALRVFTILVLLGCLQALVIPVSAQAGHIEAGCPASPAGSTGIYVNEENGQNLLSLLPQSASITPVPARTFPAVSPVVVPVRANRTGLLAALERNAVDRPKVAVPLFWLLLLLLAAIAGTIGFFYFFLRQRCSRGRPVPANSSVASRHATVIDPSPQSPAPDAGSAGIAPGPAVSFPPSLEKRFTHPEFIGEGGLARVFRTYDPRLQKTVAVKVPIRYDEITGRHFTRDIFIWQNLRHENIIEMYSSNILPVPYVEMEYAPGSLAQLPLPLPEEKALFLVSGIARGLAYAHERGVIHRDIKPENILLSEDGTPKITDWGLGRDIANKRQSSVLGYSPVYAAPEQISPGRFGMPGPATDIYQLGVLLYELLTGVVPFRDEAPHDLSQAILNEAPDVPEFPGENGTRLRAILIRCLAKNPADRYASVASLLTDLDGLAETGTRKKERSPVT